MVLLIPDDKHTSTAPAEDDNRSAKGIVLANCVTAETAASTTGYHIQYIRRLAFEGKLEALRVGRAWLINLTSLKTYLKRAERMGDNRYGPHLLTFTKVQGEDLQVHIPCEVIDDQVKQGLEWIAIQIAFEKRGNAWSRRQVSCYTNGRLALKERFLKVCVRLV